MKKQPSARAIQLHLKNDLEAATSRAVHDGLPFIQIAKIALQQAARMASMFDIAQRLDREELARARRKKR